MPSEIVTESEVLENVKRNILEEKRAYLCKYLNPDDHFDFLRSKFIISKDDQDRIKKETTQSAKAGKLLDILSTKGPSAYEMLVLSIQRNKTQTFLVAMLNKEFENKKNSYIALLKDKKLSLEADLQVDTESLPKPNSRSRKQCVESVDRTLDFEELCIRGSYVECPNRTLYNGDSENSERNMHDTNCPRHQSDV